MAVIKTMKCGRAMLWSLQWYQQTLNALKWPLVCLYLLRTNLTNVTVIECVVHGIMHSLDHLAKKE